MNVVVTGATSFVGSATVKELIGCGHTVYAVVRPGSKNMDALTDHKCLNLVEMDLAQLDNLPCEIAKACDVFIHFGWGGSGSESRKDRALQHSNVKTSMLALEAARKLRCSRFLFSGSQAEYGLHHLLMDEEAECAPLSEYGIAKLEVKRMAQERCLEYGMDYGHIRIFSVYGPGDHPWSLVSSCLNTFLNGGTIELGDCTGLWNFLYIDDAARGFARLAAYEGSLTGHGCVYNLAGDGTQTGNLRRFVETMYQLCGQRGSYLYGVRPPNAEGRINLIPDISKIENVTGWKPQVSFEQGITKILRNYENVKDLDVAKRDKGD